MPDGEDVSSYGRRVREGAKRYLHTPNHLPGVNPWHYRWPDGREVPTVLVHGTFLNFPGNWSFVAPYLQRCGHVVFGVNYGQPPLSLGGRLGGMRSVTACVAEVDAFVDRVLRATGAPSVHLVGHSLGGLVAAYYCKRGEGLGKVSKVVAVAPTTRGTMLYGGALASRRHGGYLAALRGPFTRVATAAECAALPDQIAGSDLLRDLWADGDDMPTGVEYLTIGTTHDISVTPIQSQALVGPTARSVLVQDVCPDNTSDHRTIVFDECVAHLTHRFLRGEPLRCALR